LHQSSSHGNGNHAQTPTPTLAALAAEAKSSTPRRLSTKQPVDFSGRNGCAT
jgi:hypothetical protein